MRAMAHTISARTSARSALRKYLFTQLARGIDVAEASLSMFPADTQESCERRHAQLLAHVKGLPVEERNLWQSEERYLRIRRPAQRTATHRRSVRSFSTRTASRRRTRARSRRSSRRARSSAASISDGSSDPDPDLKSFRRESDRTIAYDEGRDAG
jgi:hypothetical protein